MIEWKVEIPTRSKSALDRMTESLLVMLIVAALVKVTIQGRAFLLTCNSLTMPATHVVDLPEPGSATARLLPVLVEIAVSITVCSGDNITALLDFVLKLTYYIL